MPTRRKIIFETISSFLILTAIASMTMAEPLRDDLPSSWPREVREKVAKINRDFWPDFEKRWQIWLLKAGKPRDGLQLFVTTLPNVVKKTQKAELLISIKNVSDRQVEYQIHRSRPLPAVMVHDVTGKSAPLTVAGLDEYGPSASARFYSGACVRLKPGWASGCAYSIDNYFTLKREAKYTMLTAASLSPLDNWSDFLVGLPVQFEISRDDVLRRVVAKTQAHLPNDNGGIKNSDNEWKRAAALAGRPLFGSVLEALMSPVSPGKLIVSLCCVNLEDKTHTDLPITNAHDYRILVHDPVGNPVKALQERGNTAKTHNASGAGDRNQECGLGDAVAAAIPLTEWFDMATTGEYSVLVTLPVVGRPDKMWVAVPIKVFIDQKQPRRK